MAPRYKLKNPKPKTINYFIGILLVNIGGILLMNINTL